MFGHLFFRPRHEHISTFSTMKRVGAWNSEAPQDSCWAHDRAPVAWVPKLHFLAVHFEVELTNEHAQPCEHDSKSIQICTFFHFIHMINMDQTGFFHLRLSHFDAGPLNHPRPKLSTLEPSPVAKRGSVGGATWIAQHLWGRDQWSNSRALTATQLGELQ